jgi:hypothetical protein
MLANIKRVSEIYTKLKNRLYRNFSDTVKLGFEKTDSTNMGRVNPFEITVLWNLETNIQDIGIICEDVRYDALVMPYVVQNTLNSVELKKQQDQLRMAGPEFDTKEIVFSKVVYLYTNSLKIDAEVLKKEFLKNGYRLRIRCFENLREEKRIALIIGNGDYESLPKLNNASNDAEDMNQSLKRLGFETILFKNLTKSDFHSHSPNIVDQFKNQPEILIYYAGHGYYMNGVHYLIPTDSNVSCQSDLEENGIRLDELIRLTQDSGDEPIRTIILDACRLPSLPDYSEAAMERIELTNSFIAFATSIGSAAKDGISRNGRFTSALLSNIEKPDATINEIFELVNKEVSSVTKGEQIPWFQSSLTNEYMLNELIKFT